MRKGRLKEDRKRISILFIPHSSNKIKAIKFSAYSSKLLAISLVTFIALICLTIFVIHTINENHRLNESVKQYETSITEQNNLLNEKLNEIIALRQKENAANKSIKEFSEKYKDLTNTLVTSKLSDTKTNRSGDTSTLSFINGINDLKIILDNLQKINDSGNIDLTETETKLKNYINSIPTLWPTSGRISSTYGSREDPFSFTSKFHDGIDIAADYGQSVKAAGDGTVSLSGSYSGYGNAVIINHGHGISTIYGHNSKLLVKKGQKVKKGDVIAKVGSSGRSTGSHLHFEVRINDSPIDPFKFLKK